MTRLSASTLVTLVAAAVTACSAEVAAPAATDPTPTTIHTPVPPSATPTATQMATPTVTPTSTVTPSPTPAPTSTPTPRPTVTPTCTPTSPPSPTPAPTMTPTEAVSLVYRPAFGIDYGYPERYLSQGEQSRISDPTQFDGLRVPERRLAHLGAIYRWLKSDFTSYSAGGRTIGVVTVDQLLEERRLGGCHDHALVYAAVARELGYPAVMARTDSIAWVERFQAGEPNPHVGHVFVEVSLNDRWLLIDPTNGWYVEEGYDPAHPVIPLKGPIAGSTEEIYGFYVECKGIDVWDFGIHTPEESTQAMDDLARQLDLDTITYPVYHFRRFGN